MIYKHFHMQTVNLNLSLIFRSSAKLINPNNSGNYPCSIIYLKVLRSSCINLLRTNQIAYKPKPHDYLLVSWSETSKGFSPILENLLKSLGSPFSVLQHMLIQLLVQDPLPFSFLFADCLSLVVSPKTKLLE